MARITGPPGRARMTPAQREAANHPRKTCGCGHSEQWHAEVARSGTGNLSARAGACGMPGCRCAHFTRPA